MKYIFVLIAIFVASAFAPLKAYAQYSPQNITIKMYMLDPDTSALYEDANGNTVICSDGIRSYGCSWDTTKPYPYDSNPITIPIEGHYLINVVPREMNTEPESVGGSDFHPEALRAQAIVARTYALNKIAAGGEIDNSTNNQVFVPRVFDRLDLAADYKGSYKEWTRSENPCTATNADLSETQREVCTALNDKLYISIAGQNKPAFTEFSADPERFASGDYKTTEAGGILRSVSDPISQKCFPKPAPNGALTFGHGRGMTQNGASRWARGDMCSTGPRFSPWSVTYGRAEQILVHYYSGIDIIALQDIKRNNTVVFTAGSKVVPPNRWNPLSIQGLPSIISNQVTAKVRVQNTGIAEWKCDSASSYRLGYAWVDNSGNPPPASDYSYTTICAAGSNDSISTGKDRTISISITPPSREGPTKIFFDVQRVGFPTPTTRTYSSIRSQSIPWDPYSVRVCVKSCRTGNPYVNFFPNLLSNGETIWATTTTTP